MSFRAGTLLIGAVPWSVGWSGYLLKIYKADIAGFKAQQLPLREPPRVSFRVYRVLYKRIAIPGGRGQLPGRSVRMADLAP